VISAQTTHGSQNNCSPSLVNDRITWPIPIWCTNCAKYDPQDYFNLNLRLDFKPCWVNSPWLYDAAENVHTPF